MAPTICLILVQAVAKVSKVYPKDTEAPPGGVDDMTRLSYLHEPGVLQNLGTRYELNEIYVSHQRWISISLPLLLANSYDAV